MKIREVMTDSVIHIHPDESVAVAARTLTQQRRVKEEGFRVVNFFYQGRRRDGTWRKSHG